MDHFLEELQPEQSFFVTTGDLKLILHLVKGQYYLKKLASKDPRYCLVTAINGSTRYKQQDLDLGAEIEYMHPRLNREVNAGRITSITLR